ncbi:hypothetical protein HJC06_01265 [Rhizobium sp. NLR9b]|uniref:NACHT domain-containing protein n=1 Tax=unclassified Rhizobium TaxID=2613769 RepID=UPI001C8346F1|nr:MULTISPECIES: hypothetical protein [unclassified Rhizobium]MBX5225078.1 hypothetical protein [Rhizobium sp. NLR9b]
MSKYYFLTNVKGTSHLNGGSIDRVNDALSKAFEVEAFCWWRDDLDRRLDGQASIKWSYPDILKATDLLEKLVSGQLGEEEERRRSALLAYMNSQYEDDEELKFKQTDLRSTMTDLFVDLPMRFLPQSVRHVPHYTPQQLIFTRDAPIWSIRDGVEYERNSQKAADYFIYPYDFPRHSRIVLEGAPGQGKSTVTQFVCQVLRMQLLDKKHQISLLPPNFRRPHARIPFRVDLRDLAKWLSGVDPFVSKPQALSEQEPRSLEGFLAGQVRFFSGGHSFNVSDLTAIARASHMLLALDGFDEVADINLRQRLVDEITKGTNRLISAGGFSLQTIVTSRPAAFAKSVRFPPEQWSYFELLPLESEQIEEYTTKWMKAKGLKEAQQGQLRVILDNKLREAHTQYLAKNPMQLTILLSLINIRGASLPDKRTAMYDAYMDMFFSRESEKSELVRDNRDLLIDIHRYLAWKLQSGAEAGDNGSIEQSLLKATLFSYLDREGEDTTIVNSLFDGMIERVGALVSRVQGTYEFEVQPLREYFAARHLYETAPYPVDDQPVAGDKFDRFKALVGNPYWLNVARFYGGCFNKGEILTLVNELVELSRAAPYRLTSHSRSVALMLLGDWVFNQYQPAVKQIVSHITEYPHFRSLLANAEEPGPSLWANLPDRSGRTDFLEHLWSRLAPSTPTDEQRALANAIIRNSSAEDRIESWEALSAKLSPFEWARLGAFLGLLNPDVFVLTQASKGHLSDELVQHFIMLRHFRFLSQPSHFERAKAMILNGSVVGPYRCSTSNSTLLEILAAITSPYQYQQVFVDTDDVPLEMAIERRLSWERAVDERQVIADVKVAFSKVEEDAIEAYETFVSMPTSLLATKLAPWSDLVKALRRAWGDCPAIDRIACIGAGIRAKTEAGDETPLASARDLVGSARHIRRKSGAPRWWEEKLSSVSTSSETRRLLLLLMLWGTPKTLFETTEKLESALDSLTETDWRNLVRDFRASRLREADGGTYVTDKDIAALSHRGPRIITFIGFRLPERIRYHLALSVAGLVPKKASPEVQFALQSLLQNRSDMSRLKKDLERISDLYLSGATANFRNDGGIPISKAIAESIMSNAEKFPLHLLAQADRTLMSAAGKGTPKLLEVAQREGWFPN